VTLVGQVQARTVLALLLMMAAAAVFIAADLLSPAGAPDPRVTEVISGPGYAAAGSLVTGTVTLTASRPFTVRSVGIDVRDASGKKYALPGRAIKVRLGPNSYTLRSLGRTLAVGRYTLFGYWQGASGVFHVSPSRPLIVGRRDLSPGSPNGIPGRWDLKLDDEFSGRSVDASIWRTGWFGTGVTAPASQSEQVCYSSANVSFHGDGAVDLGVTPRRSECGGSDHPYTGALLSSNPSDGRAGGGFQYTYGVVAARVYLPAAGPQIANWPAVWATGQHWPADGEDDIMEGLSGRACFHFRTSDRGPPTCIPGQRTGWHTFASDWEPGSVTYYFDGIRVGGVTINVTAAPMYLVLAYTVSRSIGGPVVVPSTMGVDYIRVWQH
jgi:beta-glucanase (GH16 family)